MEIENKVYFGKVIKFIIDQKIGEGKMLDTLREKYEVKKFVGNGETIVLVESKENNES